MIGEKEWRHVTGNARRLRDTLAFCIDALQVGRRQKVKREMVQGILGEMVAPLGMILVECGPSAGNKEWLRKQLDALDLPEGE